MKILWLVVVLAAACGKKSEAPDDKSGGDQAAPPAADDQKSLCAELKAWSVKYGATPRDVFDANCMAAPKQVVLCSLHRYYDTHKAECKTALDAYPKAVEIR